MRALNIIFFVLSISVISIGQASTDNDDRVGQFSIFISKGYRYVSISTDYSNEWSNIGIEIQKTWKINERVKLALRSGWIKWPKNRETVIPLLLGPGYDIIDSKSFRVMAYGTLGPMGVIGNDYAGVFAKYELGFQFSSSNTGGLTAGISWGQDVVFHPSDYAVVKGSVGWIF